MINFSEACERNKEPIAEQLIKLFANYSKILEIGSGSGQHALHFAEQLPHATWQPSDLSPYFESLSINLHHRPSNILAPQQIHEDNDIWLPEGDFDALFSANTLHIMPWPQVEAFFARSGKQLGKNTRLCIYGPFKYNGAYTSASNADFDQWLESRQAGSGIRDIEKVTEQANKNGFELISDTKMPANNQLLCFDKV